MERFYKFIECVGSPYSAPHEVSSIAERIFILCSMSPASASPSSISSSNSGSSGCSVNTGGSLTHRQEFESFRFFVRPPVRTANPTLPSCSSIFLSVLFDDYSSFHAREILTSVMVRSGCVECVSELGAKRDIGRLPQTVIARQDIYPLRR